MTEDTWPNACVLCAARGRQTRLKFGHCCAACADRITADLRAIPELAAMAAASIVPGQGTTGSLNTAYGSKPPINLDAVDPALAHVPGHDAPLLVILEEWERLTREERGYVPYGPASAARNRAVTTDHTQATLVGVCGFLALQVEWIVSEPDFPLEDFADEVSQCVRAVRRWDVDAQDLGTMVQCPTIDKDADSECGYRLYYREMDEHVTCRRCGVTRDAATLVAVAMSEQGRTVWVDEEAACQHYRVSEKSLRQWARSGWVRMSHGRYNLGDIPAAQERAREQAYRRLAGLPVAT